MDRAPDHIFATGVLLHRDALPSLFLKRLCDRWARLSAHNHRCGSIRAPQQVPRGDWFRPGRTADAGDWDPQTRSHRERQEQLRATWADFLYITLHYDETECDALYATTPHILYRYKFRQTEIILAHVHLKCGDSLGRSSFFRHMLAGSAASSVLRFATLLLDVAEARAAGELEQELHRAGMGFADAVFVFVVDVLLKGSASGWLIYWFGVMMIPCLAGYLVTRRWIL